MPVDALTLIRAQLRTLADAWLESGASSYSIWVNGDCLLCWPVDVSPDSATLVEPIERSGQTVGQLKLVGLDTPAAQARLHAEAELLGRLISSERELEDLTSELVNMRDQLLAFYELTRATRNVLELEQVLVKLASESRRLFEVESSFLAVQMVDQPLLVKHEPHPLLDTASLIHYLDQIQAGEGALLNHCRSNLLETNGRIRNILLVPIQLRGATTAALGLVNKIGREFESPDIKLAKAIAQYANVQIENVIMYQASLKRTRLQTEMRLAQQVQSHLLPRQRPSVEGLDIWADNRSAYHVGGDFYDFVCLRSQPFTFAVGDISGKGMSAALLMAMTRTIFRSKAGILPIQTPQTLMEQSNTALYDDFTRVNMFATLFVGQYDPVQRQLLYANAGHAPVIYCPARGEARLLQADSMPIGVLPTSLARDQRLELLPGDVLVVATDGFSESRNAEQQIFGWERLVQLVESLAHLSAEAMADKLYQAVASFAGEELQDDQTLVILKRTGS